MDEKVGLGLGRRTALMVRVAWKQYLSTYLGVPHVEYAGSPWI